MTFGDRMVKMRAIVRVAMHPVKTIRTLTIWDMIRWSWKYDGVTDGLIQLPVPDTIKIGRKHYPVPTTMEQFGDAITYGQRMFMTWDQPTDVATVIHYIVGFYYPIVTGEKWDENNAIAFAKKIVYSHVIETYPVAYHFIKLMTQLTERELSLLKREPSVEEREAGIDKLGRFAELTAIMFLMDSFKCSESNVKSKPYNDCLVRFMLQREQNAYADRLAAVYKRKTESKTKSK